MCGDFRVEIRQYIHFVCREVLANPSLLNLPDRIDWKQCKQSRDEEIEWTNRFRKRFQEFDFNFK